MSATMLCAKSPLMKKKADTASYSDELVITVFTSIRNDNAGGDSLVNYLEENLDLA